MNVEMQLINQYNMTKRTLYYWSKIFLSQINVGGQYETLNKTITINLLNFNFLDFEKFHSFYHLYEDELKVKLTDIMEIHFIEMKKLQKANKDINDKLYKWISFINNPEMEGESGLEVIDMDMQSFRENLAAMDKISRINGARKEGRQEVKIEIAKKLLDVLDDETIADITGLSIPKVNELRSKTN
ncbi:MAG: Rpn family recombination-promoting nuclease/putative transposase [Clostridium sp.]